MVAKAETGRVDAAQMPPQPANFGTGNGVLGVLPASSVPASPPSQAMAYADPPPASRKPFSRTAPSSRSPPTPDGSSRSARWRAKAKRASASTRRATRPVACSARPIPFTEPVVAKGDRKLFRARFAGLDRDQAEAVCRTLKRSEISCITVKN